ncbi:hypothetical protein DFP72DRAFT_1076367 [Ephemerocybe angulata]|uniref:Uncharacterized protein n=1 Tax=Ephemerocybe angulata TaxID=980116 RepID=A0A8H6HIP9_9AGAR|nr:hypothetical protein DFP72DRAFT_1076367 [Tulosesus angulatus]
MPYEMPTLPTNGLVGHVGPLVDAHGGHVDPRFAEVVATLPNVEHVFLLPFTTSQGKVDRGIDVGEFSAALGRSPTKSHLQERLKALLQFDHWNCIVNPARASLEVIRPSHIGSSTGLCATSNLRSPATRMVGSQLSSDHRVGLYPFDYEWQRSLRFIGATADQTLLAVDYEAGMLSFVTRCEGQDIPNISSLLWSTAMTPLDSISRDEYPTALNFSDDVPIFLTTDPQYEFNHTSFNNLLALPRHNAEIPLGSLITVGYTAVTFPYDSSPIPETRAFTLNVQFVLLHSYPPQSSSSA